MMYFCRLVGYSMFVHVCVLIVRASRVATREGFSVELRHIWIESLASVGVELFLNLFVGRMVPKSIDL